MQHVPHCGTFVGLCSANQASWRIVKRIGVMRRTPEKAQLLALASMVYHIQIAN